MFTIYVYGTVDEWKKDFGSGEEDMGLPLVKLGVKNGEVYVCTFPTDFQYDVNEESKQCVDEYEEMIKQRKEIFHLSSLLVISKG